MQLIQVTYTPSRKTFFPLGASCLRSPRYRRLIPVLSYYQYAVCMHSLLSYYSTVYTFSPSLFSATLQYFSVLFFLFINLFPLRVSIDNPSFNNPFFRSYRLTTLPFPALFSASRLGHALYLSTTTTADPSIHHITSTGFDLERLPGKTLVLLWSFYSTGIREAGELRGLAEMPVS